MRSHLYVLTCDLLRLRASVVGRPLLHAMSQSIVWDCVDIFKLLAPIQFVDRAQQQRLAFSRQTEQLFRRRT